jgi:hypothetical protein
VLLELAELHVHEWEQCERKINDRMHDPSGGKQVVPSLIDLSRKAVMQNKVDMDFVNLPSTSWTNLF